MKNNNMKKTIGIVIKKMREDMQLSQVKFGKLLKKDNSIVCRWESGERTPSMVEYRELIETFNSFMEKKVKV